MFLWQQVPSMFSSFCFSFNLKFICMIWLLQLTGGFSIMPILANVYSFPSCFNSSRVFLVHLDMKESQIMEKLLQNLFGSL